MIVNQYKPQIPGESNQLHQLTLMRMQAREDADKAYDKLHDHVYSFFEPEKKRTGLLTFIVSNLSVITTGISIGRRLVAAFRR